MSTVKDQQWESFDITVWYRNHEICPNCGINTRDMHPLQNLYPHWVGTCRQWRDAGNAALIAAANNPSVQPVQPQKTGFWQHIKWLWQELEELTNSAINGL